MKANQKMLQTNSGAGQATGAVKPMQPEELIEKELDVVRDTASLANGCVTIVVNCFFDAKVARDEAFAFGTLPE